MSRFEIAELERELRSIDDTVRDTSKPDVEGYDDLDQF